LTKNFALGTLDTVGSPGEGERAVGEVDGTAVDPARNARRAGSQGATILIRLYALPSPSRHSLWNRGKNSTM
jgi:hypothetical protein